MATQLSSPAISRHGEAASDSASGTSGLPDASACPAESFFAFSTSPDQYASKCEGQGTKDIVQDPIWHKRSQYWAGPIKHQSPPRDSQHRQSIDSQGKTLGAAAESNRDRKKGSSFLSRLAIRGAWKKDDDMNDSDSELGELRTDGFNAKALTTVVGAGGGYIPFHKEPPRYIRVTPCNKKTSDFNHLFLAQELLGTKRASEDEARGREPATAVGSKILKAGDAIWATEFSLDGQYLAVAGKDQTVRVFSVISTPEERRACEEEEESHGRGVGEKLSAPVFRSKPAREFQGHTGEVLDLSWSKNNFLLSSSMDKTVRLWHMSRPECLCTFKHNDLVTSIAFHPTDDRFFLAGSLDAQLRLWSIPDKAVAFSATANDFITAVAFTPDGKMAICGLLSGLCLFYETEGLKLDSQIHVRSSRGKNAKGSKITGIRTAFVPPEDGEEIKVLISSNDSRVRIYNLRTKMLEVKFRGLENQSSQIHASFSDDGAYIISGSEDRRAYIWSASSADNDLKDKQPYECFDAHPEVVTTALMAPTKMRQLLSASGDPIFDLCNPPPVMLLSLEERNASQTKFSEGGQTDGAASVRKPEESPAYLERSKHLDGNIIITTDRTGTIKVFRQDCAYAKRQQSQWETGSKFSGRRAGGVGRSGSTATRTSTGSRVHSRGGSLNLGTASQLAQPASDRIMSWRQGVEGRPSMGLATSRSDRSLSPLKSSRTPLNSSAANLASEARKLPYASSLASRTNIPGSPTSSGHTGRDSARMRKDRADSGGIPLTPSFSLISASESEQNESKGEGSFWNLGKWKPSITGLRYSLNASPLGSGSGNTAVNHSKVGGGDSLKVGDRGPGRRSLGVHDTRRSKTKEDADRRLSSGPTAASKPRSSESDSLGGSIEEEVEVSDNVAPKKERTDSGVAEVGADSTDDSETATCRECGGRSFKVKRIAKGKTVLSCQKCGTMTES
ncbi:WD domain, G-beta repeat containing protein [Metarhizium album ARSEF 1941]|uniref:WD domain, G-beta repeat containing protein n=1 Tax=Metarhizium album (strain ARSEF 1941) TaxID=1081103 RepID=A0A0B2X716_METAS|nr:WD domain, G-beta repeat containing protein [Metarhizium album ARSEF 1941]KHO01240.1 WD domain, G-beta repeat containing protein [Metarhizium album ARSEF 1941]